MNRHIHAGRAILMSMLFVMVSSSPMPGQGDPVEMIAGKSRTFNRHSLKVLDGPMNPAFMIADPVSSVTGEFVESATDLSVRALGMDFSFSRTWRSMADYVGPLGRGWDTPINERLVAQVDGSTGKITGIQLFDGNGRSAYFYRWDLIPNELSPATSKCLLYESGGRVFDALAGSYLQRNPLAAQHGKSDTPSATQDSLSGRFSYPGANPQGELLAFNWPSKPGPPPQLHKDRWPVARGPLTGGGGGLAGGGSWWWWR